VFLEECSRQPFQVHGERVYADLRCGLLQAPRHGADVDTIERNVMSALSEARNTGARVVVYDETFSARAQKRIDIERELRVAVERKQFELFLQPKFNARTQTLTGAEALLRWRHPQRGLVSPADFIPILEETGMILPVGRWVLQQAIAICARWRRRGHSGLRLAINLSARELQDEGFLRDSTVLLRDAGADHGVDIELTESLVMDDIARSIRLLQSLRDAGCGVAIDDYGTGYSSLNYLSRLPCDTLKIDRTFVAAISQSPESLALVTNTINLAHSLGLRVVAEGVEEEEQAKLLRLLRCDELQGYLFGKPQPIADFEKQFIE
jgi:EAL domain-containing protein (putative c-di-GMP-specific phosphodiesterase class I)